MKFPARRLLRTWSMFTDIASLAGMRLFFGVGEHLSPTLWARPAMAVWLRVPPAPPLARRDRGVPAGEPFSLIVNGRRVSGYSWGSGPIVMLAHGWAGWWQQLSLYIEPLVQAGFQVVAWDAPSHGDSEQGRFGKHRGGMPDFADANTAVAQHFGNGHVHGIVAHSAGSMTTVMAMLDGLTADRLVMIAPSISGRDQLERISRLCGWGPKLTRATAQRVMDTYDVDLYTHEIPDRVADTDIELPPALIIHDHDDPETPLSTSKRLANIWPMSRTYFTRGLGHFKVLWAHDTVAKTVAFLTAPV